MFAWVLRVFMTGVAALAVWNIGLHAVDNLRAVEFGIAGTVDVQTCEDGCRGPFVSDDGRVRIDTVELVSTGAYFEATPGRSVAAHVADPRSTGAHIDRDWPSLTLFLVFILFVLGFVLKLLTPPRVDRSLTTAGALASSAAEAAATNAGLGVRVGSWRWSGNKWLLIGGIVLTFGLSPFVGYLTVVDNPGSTVEVAIGLAWGAALTVLGAVLVGKGIAGIGRRLYLFEGGVVVLRRGRSAVYRYAEVVNAEVLRSRVGDDGPTYPYAVKLTLADGRRITISEPGAVPSIMAQVTHHD